MSTGKEEKKLINPVSGTPGGKREVKFAEVALQVKNRKATHP